MIGNIYFVKRYAMTPSIVDKPSNLLLETWKMFQATLHDFFHLEEDKHGYKRQ